MDENEKALAETTSGGFQRPEKGFISKAKEKYGEYKKEKAEENRRILEARLEAKEKIAAARVEEKETKFNQKLENIRNSSEIKKHKAALRKEKIRKMYSSVGSKVKGIGKSMAEHQQKQAKQASYDPFAWTKGQGSSSGGLGGGFKPHDIMEGFGTAKAKGKKKVNNFSGGGFSFNSNYNPFGNVKPKGKKKGKVNNPNNWY